MDDVDRQLLYLLAEAQRRGVAISTWQLACQMAKTNRDKSKLDGVFRYRLEQLAKKGLVVKKTERRGTQKLTHYMLNPSKVLCADGSLFILANPILVVECPFTSDCRCGRLYIYNGEGGLQVKGCKLLKTAPQHIKEAILKHLSSS